MRRALKSSMSRQKGFNLIEVLVTLVILLVGLLGLVGLMVQSQRSQFESYQRVQALIILQDMVNRINTNKKAVDCYVLSDAIGTDFTVPAVGTRAVGADCPLVSIDDKARADRADLDIREWNNLLLGGAETTGSRDVGAMLAARGCVTKSATTGAYTVSVVWQGSGKTAAPPADVVCGEGLYGDELLRRSVSAPLQIVSLS